MDKDKVITGLRCCIDGKCVIDEVDKLYCPYWKDYLCSKCVMRDALELLEGKKNE